MKVPVTCVDGHHARIHVAELSLLDDFVMVSGGTFQRRVPLPSVEITDAIGSAPRLVRFPDGACCEPTDRQAFADALAAAGVGRSRLSRWEGSRAGIAAALVVLAAVLAFGYRFGLPAMARVVAEAIPHPAVDRLSRHTLRVLDTTLFARTNLEIKRQAAILTAFDRLQLPATRAGGRYDIQFRKADALGPNAVALPSGIIVITDELVRIAQDDREILAVAAHEVGHVARRHGLRKLLQASAVTLFIAWFVGDVSAMTAAAPTALLTAKYSRDFEREADDYAADVLRRNGIATQYLATMLERLEAAHDGGSRDPSAFDYLSTHPATAERLARLRAR